MKAAYENKVEECVRAENICARYHAARPHGGDGFICYFPAAVQGLEMAIIDIVRGGYT